MDLDDRLCYQAVRSRDPRFDGRFFTAVLTTGIYCRPVCPARTPKRENVRFYALAAAAEAAGFRPCLRCRPEAAPGSPAWLGTSATVSRALRMIDMGFLDTASVEDLAGRLGIGPRHLRRLFLDQIGAPPRAIAATRRIHFARRLIEETDLPITEIALAAGFGSLRRFHDAVRSQFGSSPRGLRAAREGRGGGREGRIVLCLPYRPPFAWRALVSYLAPRAIPGVESIDGTGYRRAIDIADRTGVLELRPDSAANRFRLLLPLVPAAELRGIVDRCRRLLDLEADPARIDGDLSADPRIGPLVRRRPGLRLPGAWDPFELAIRAILGQQITVAGATRLAGRLAERAGRPLDTPAAGIVRCFPAPARLAETDVAALGIPRARAQAIRLLAREVAAGRIRLAHPADPDEVRTALESIPGIGAWTAAYVAIRAFGEPDLVPAADLGLRRALARNGGPIAAVEVALRAEAWRPWRSYAAMHLWTEAARSARALRRKERR